MAEDRLTVALELSRKMLVSGEAGAWECVVELAQTRCDLLDAAFKTPDEITADDGPRIQGILDLNQQLAGLARQARDKVANELAKSKRGRKATAAYHQFGA